jgi:hypothetical protein
MGEFIGGLIILAISLVISIGLATASCDSKYSSYGKTSYGPIQG